MEDNGGGFMALMEDEGAMRVDETEPSPSAQGQQPLVSLAAPEATAAGAPLVSLMAPAGPSALGAIASSAGANKAHLTVGGVTKALPVLFRGSGGTQILQYTALQDALSAPRDASMRGALNTKKHRKAAKRARALARTAADEATQRAKQSGDESDDDVPALVGGGGGGARRRREKNAANAAEEEQPPKDDGSQHKAKDAGRSKRKLGARPLVLAEALMQATPRPATAERWSSGAGAPAPPGSMVALAAGYSLLDQSRWEDNIAWGSDGDGSRSTVADSQEFDSDEADMMQQDGEAGGLALSDRPVCPADGGRTGEQADGAWDAAMDERPDAAPKERQKERALTHRTVPPTVVTCEALGSRGDGRKGRIRENANDFDYDADDDGDSEAEAEAVRVELELRRHLAGQAGATTLWGETEEKAAVRLTGSSDPYRCNAALRSEEWLDQAVERAVEGDAQADDPCMPDLNDPWLSFEATTHDAIGEVRLGGATVVLAPPPPANQVLAAEDLPDDAFNVSSDLVYTAKKKKDKSQNPGGSARTRVAHAIPALKLLTMPPAFGTGEQMRRLERAHRPRSTWDAAAASTREAPNKKGAQAKGTGTKVLVRTLAGRSTRAACDLNSPTSVFIESLAQHWWNGQAAVASLAAPPLRLYYRGTELRPDLTLGAQGIVDNSKLVASATQLTLLPDRRVPDDDRPVCPPAAFQREKNLSAEDGRVVLFEYTEEFPLMLSGRGMGGRYNAWYRRKGGADMPSLKQRQDAGSLASWQFLDKEEDSPFIADVHPGHAMCSLETSLARAPAAGQDPRPSDFLLVRHTDGHLSLRLIDRAHAVGQQEPKLEVFKPASKAAQQFEETRLLAYMYREFRKLLKADKKPGPAVVPPGVAPPQIKCTDVYSTFKPLKDEHIRRRVRHCTDLIRDGGPMFFRLKPGFVIPAEAEIRRMCTPEMACAQEAMLSACARLEAVGVDTSEEGVTPDGLRDAIAQLPEDSEARQVAINILRELQLTPWNISANFLSTVGGNGQMQLGGAGDPTGRGKGISYLRKLAPGEDPDGIKKTKAEPKKPAVDERGKKTRRGSKRQAITGTNNDLRRLTMDAARAILRRYGVSDAEILQLARWDRINLVRQLSTAAVEAGAAGTHHFARGSDVNVVRQQRQHTRKCQELFDGQYAFLKGVRGDSEGEDSGSDLESFADDLEELLDKEAKKEDQRDEAEKEAEEAKLLEEMRKGGLITGAAGAGAAGTAGADGEGADADDTAPRRVKKQRFVRLTYNVPAKEGANDAPSQKVVEIRDPSKVREWMARVAGVKKRAKAGLTKANAAAKIEGDVDLEEADAGALADDLLARKLAVKDRRKLKEKKRRTQAQIDKKIKQQQELEAKMAADPKFRREVEEAQQKLRGGGEKKDGPIKTAGTKFSFSAKLSAAPKGKKRERPSDGDGGLSSKRARAQAVAAPQAATVEDHGGGSGDAVTDAIARVLFGLVQAPHARFQAFLNPVTDDIAPGYSAVISQPMDLSTMSARNRSRGYTSLDAALDDLQLVRDNCFQYNSLPALEWLRNSAEEMLHTGREDLRREAAAAGQALAAPSAQPSAPEAPTASIPATQQQDPPGPKAKLKFKFKPKAPAP